MKNLLLLPVFLILISSTIKSQDTLIYSHQNDDIKTIFGKQKSSGFYGAIKLGYSFIDNKNAFEAGARFAGVINHYLSIGFGGTCFASEYNSLDDANGLNSVAGIYGGMYIEPIVLGTFPVHLSFPVLLGGGSFSNYTYDSNNIIKFVDHGCTFLILEPSAELELNLTRHVRLALGAGYRLPKHFNYSASRSPAPDVSVLQGMTYSMTFKFGKF
jgi:hypothetical protein